MNNDKLITICVTIITVTSMFTMTDPKIVIASALSGLFGNMVAKINKD